MNDILLRAILAMDAYNQGYNPGVLGVGEQIGTATKFLQSDINPDEVRVSAGFYAVAYALADGSKVISYRGTDSLIFDPFTGWPVAFGSTTSSQAAAASPSDNAPLILARAG